MLFLFYYNINYLSDAIDSEQYYPVRVANEV